MQSQLKIGGQKGDNKNCEAIRLVQIKAWHEKAHNLNRVYLKPLKMGREMLASQKRRGLNARPIDLTFPDTFWDGQEEGQK